MWKSALLAVGLLIAASPAAANSHPRATFRATTDGSPVATQFGRWSVQDNEATLVIGGGHAIPGGTKFTAMWLTPMHEPEGGSHEFELEGHYVNQNETERVVLRRWLRYRVERGRWSRWQLLNPQVFNPGTTWGREWGMTQFIEDGEGPISAPMQFQLKLTGKVTKPSSLDMIYRFVYS